jgi:uncharacterized membrane protein YeaQ/YmgE (transglycosylase-associated protein family)
VLLIVLTAAALSTGWATDLILQRVGFGILGNTLVLLIGLFAGLALMKNGLGRFRPSEVVMFLIPIATAMVALLTTTTFKRVLRL